MKIHEKLKDVDKWIAYTENLIKNYPDSESYKNILIDLKQKQVLYCI